MSFDDQPRPDQPESPRPRPTVDHTEELPSGGAPRHPFESSQYRSQLPEAGTTGPIRFGGERRDEPAAEPMTDATGLAQSFGDARPGERDGQRPEPAARTEPLVAPVTRTEPLLAPSAGGYPGPQPGPGQPAPGQPGSYAGPGRPGAPGPLAPAPWDPNHAYRGGAPAPGGPGQPGGPGLPPGGYGATPQAAAAPRRRGGGLLAGALTGALLVGLLGGLGGAYAYDEWLDEPEKTTVATQTAGGTTAQQQVDRPAGSVQDVAAKALPAVVTIRGESGSNQWTGSGFVYRVQGDEGFIITNAHVATPFENPTLCVELHDGTQLDAEVAGSDTAYDIAVLKVRKSDLPVLDIADSDKAVIGDSVIAIGSPFRLTETVTTGIISAKDRPVASSDGGTNPDAFISAIQTDAAINPGNSGGPLLDATGKVVGVNAAGKSVPNQQSGFSIGLGFAIPSNQAKKTADELIEKGRATHPYVGASFDTGYDKGDGARIIDRDEAIVKDGPADKAGLQKGDLITAVDGKRVTSLVEFVVIIRAKSVGDTVKVTYQRGGEEKQADVTLQGKTEEG